MPRGSPEHTRNRMEEIVDACARLYATREFGDVTIKDIAELTSFTRPSIYNYFETREEIFLGLLEREYLLWAADLRDCQPVTGKDPKRQFAWAVAGTLAECGTMLRLLANNLMEIESNSRMERLIGFKRVYGESIEALGSCLSRFCPEMTPEEVDGFVSCYLPMVYGLHPYTSITEKQREAMDAAGVRYEEHSIFELARRGAEMLLGVPRTTEGDKEGE